MVETTKKGGASYATSSPRGWKAIVAYVPC